MARTCSVVPLPAIYAACDGGMRVIIFLAVRLIMIIARIFRRVESSITGLQLAGGPLFLPGLGRGTSIPFFISVGYSPVEAILLRRQAIPMIMS